MRYLRYLSLMFILAACWATGTAFALETPSEEAWEQIRADGLTTMVEQNMLRLNEESQGVPLSREEILADIDRDYGLPTQKLTRTTQAGTLRANLDMNDVIDERDILPLGFSSDERSASSTVGWGTSGTFRPNVLVLLIKFPDQEPTDEKNGGTADINHDTAWAEGHWLTATAPADLEETSVSYYYDQASFGKFSLTGDVYNDTDFSSSICDSDGWITSAYNRADIDGYGDPNDPYDVIEDALQQIDPYVDFADYDANGDGCVDGLVTIYAGPDDYSGNMWHWRWVGWTHYTSDNVKVYSGVWSAEEAYIRTWCHEYGHELGLCDLYDVGGSSSGDDMPGTGYWGLMSSWTTSIGKIPPMPNAWERTRLRFVTPVEVLTTSSPVSLTVNRATSAAETDTVFRIWRNGYYGKEYFLLEYRDTDNDTLNFDQNLPGGGGILIWHVNEDRTNAKNQDNAFDPQRVWLECADDPGDPYDGNNPWRSGYNGADGVDYFSDSTTPNAHDYDGSNTSVVIDPTGSPGGASMGVDVTNAAASGLPSLTWDSPASGATVSGNTTVDVTSDADTKVEYYVDGCLKYIETGPGPYSGFSWDTVTALDSAVTLRAVAYNSTGNDPVTVSERSVTVNNGSFSGQSMVWSDDFDSYSSDTDPDLLGLWNLHEDAFGLDIQILSEPVYGGSGKSIAFAQSSFPAPAAYNTDDPNAGVYTGEDDEWLMTPRIGLYGYSDIDLKYRLSFKSFYYGEGVLVTQISDDDGATWDDLAHHTFFNDGASDYFCGAWQSSPPHWWEQKVVDLDAYANQDVYIRFMYWGGRVYNVGMVIDDFQITGTALPLSLTSASPARVRVGDSLTLVGAGFHDTQGSGEVRFNDGSGGYVAASSITSWTSTQIVCTVPDGATTHATDGVWVYQDFIETDAEPLTVVLAAPTINDLDQIQ